MPPPITFGFPDRQRHHSNGPQAAQPGRKSWRSAGPRQTGPFLGCCFLVCPRCVRDKAEGQSVWIADLPTRAEAVSRPAPDRHHRTGSGLRAVAAGTAAMFGDIRGWARFWNPIVTRRFVSLPLVVGKGAADKDAPGTFLALLEAVTRRCARWTKGRRAGRRGGQPGKKICGSNDGLDVRLAGKRRRQTALATLSPNWNQGRSFCSRATSPPSEHAGCRTGLTRAI